jgi:hypothetical protein
LFAKAGFTRVRKIAVLDTVNRKVSNDFLETTARNRGVRFKFFYSSEQEVLNWFNEEDIKYD